MQQRQPRLGDILDDYCPRERRLTNHAVVAMVGDAVKQTRCTTCESEHEYKHARVPRPRKKGDQSALYSQVLAGVAPKRVVAPAPAEDEVAEESVSPDRADAQEPAATDDSIDERAVAAWVAQNDQAEPVALSPDTAPDRDDSDERDDEERGPAEEGPVHRPLIRAQLPRHEGQVASTRQAPDFTIRMPATGRANRFRHRPQRGGQQFQGNRNGNQASGNQVRGSGPRPQGRPADRSRGHRRGSGRNRPK